jgi:GAF domain-containing protein
MGTKSNYITEREFKLLHEIDVASLNSLFSPNEAFKVIFDRMKQLVRADFVSILVIEGDQLVERFNPLRSQTGILYTLSNSVTGLAVKKKDYIYLPDVTVEPLYQPTPEGSMRSELAIPLLSENPIGVLNVESKSLNAFSKREINLLLNIASKIAIALGNERFYRELEALREIDKAILNSEYSLEQTLQVILDSSVKLINAPYGEILMVEGEDLVIKSSTVKQGDVLVNKIVKIKDSIAGRAVIQSKTIRIGDIGKDPLYKQVIDGEAMRSEMVVPLIVDDQVIGVLNIESPDLYAFTAHDRDLLETLAGQAAIAIRNAQYNEEVKQIKMIKALGDTAAWVVHKIGNLALRISWPIERLKAAVAEDDMSAQEDIGMIVNALNEIVEMRKKLLLPESDSEQVDLEELLMEVIDKSQLPIDIFELDIGRVSPVKAVRSDLYFIFEELFENGMEAMREVKNKKIRVMIRPCNNRDCVEVKISDSGCGIDPESIDLIWVIGYTTKPNQKGTGYGLYRVAQYIYKINGRITVQSLKATGTAFTMILPI